VDGRKYQSVVNVKKRGYANADAGLPDQITDFFLQFTEGVYIIEVFEVKQAGFNII
jgi:hypothetical protein